MAHKALLVGINKYPGAPLQGCVNDVHDMAAYLTAHRGFASTDISLLLDHAATTRAISKALKTLVAGVKPGDRVLFHYSGHGAQVPTRNPAGEIDGLDEVICPVDFDWMDAHMIRDKDFHALFSTIPAGVDFVWVSDSCHSGDLSKAMPRPMTTSRAFPAPDHIAWEIAQAKSQGVRSRSLGTASLPLNVALVSGCKSDQTSADAFFGHRYNGALSYYLLQTLAKVGDSMPLQALVPQVALALQKNGYEQVPQWEGSADLAHRKFLSA